MDKKHEIIKVDEDLQVELYHFINFHQTYPCHSHACYVIALVESEAGRLVCNHEEYIVKPGDFILINPGDHHICGPLDVERGWTYRAINISAEAVRAYCKLNGCDELPVFQVHSASHEIIRYYFLSFHTLLLGGGESRITKRKESFSRLLQTALREFAEYGAISVQPNETVRLLTTSIEENYNKNITIQVLCEELHLCQRDVQRQFKKELGITPRRYLLTWRVNEAQKLLKADILISEVAVQVGFFDHAHFTKAFKSLLGVTPAEYKQSVYDASNYGK